MYLKIDALVIIVMTNGSERLYYSIALCTQFFTLCVTCTCRSQLFFSDKIIMLFQATVLIN